MNLPDLRAQMEAEFSWRQDEIRFLHNRLADLADLSQQDRYRRALVLMLYAHFEGFCKFCLSLYVNTVNGEGITCGQANYAIAAAALSNVFRDLRDPSKKCDEFRRALPDDTKIHRFARDREFLERTDDFGQKPVTIPDLLVDTESNLTPVVLRKNLYRLGFSSNQFDQFEGNINRLLMTRNRIAHGESSSGVDAKTYTDLHTIVFEIMAEVTMQVTQALNGRLYLRAPVADPGNVPTLSPTI